MLKKTFLIALVCVNTIFAGLFLLLLLLTVVSGASEYHLGTILISLFFIGNIYFLVKKTF